MAQDEDIQLDKASRERVRKMDEACCNLIAARPSLSFLLQSTAKEFAQTSLDDIASRYIEGTPEVGTAPLDADRREAAPKIPYDAVSDKTLTEGTVHFDILFSALSPADDNGLDLFINIENQTKWNPGYPLLHRAIFYAGRLISRQKNRAFIHSDYGSLRKVYSIWICTHPPKGYENTVTHFTLEPQYTIGNAPFPESDYDKITIVMICLSRGDAIHKDKDVIRFLDVLLNMNMPLEERRQILEKDYAVEMNKEMEQEVEEMCSIGEMIARENLELGRTQGFSQGSDTRNEQIALRMLQNGEPPNKIMMYTDYTTDRLDELARKNGIHLKH